MARLKALIAGIATILVLIVVVQNTEAVETRFLIWSFTLPRALLLLLTLAAGVAVGLLWSLRLRSDTGTGDG